MGLNKQFIHNEPCGPITEEEQKKCDLAWKILCERGHVNIVNPLDTETESITEQFRHDPNKFLSSIVDYTGDIPFDEFIKQLMIGEYDEKR